MPLNFNDAISGLPMWKEFDDLDERQQQPIVRRLLERLVDQAEARDAGLDEHEHLHLGKAAFLVNTPMWKSALATAMIACKPVANRIPVLDSGAPIIPTGKTLRELLNAAPFSHEPCPSCGEIERLESVLHPGTSFVRCKTCGHMGPERLPKSNSDGEPKTMDVWSACNHHAKTFNKT